jgi:hypothetical protein
MPDSRIWTRTRLCSLYDWGANATSRAPSDAGEDAEDASRKAQRRRWLQAED